MDAVVETKSLTHAGAMTMLAAGIARAEAIGAPQNIVIVDASGEVLALVRMAGAKFLSRKSATAKARTAASLGARSDSIPEDMRPKIAAATGGDVTGLTGGFPIIVSGMLLGGIGVGSGSPDEDADVATAALAAIGAEN